MRTRTPQPSPQHRAESRANPPPAGVEPTQREVTAVSRGSYSRCWGVRAAAGPRSPSSRSFCRSGKQSPHRAGVTFRCQAWLRLPPHPQRSRDIPVSVPEPTPTPNPSALVRVGPPCQPHAHPGAEGQRRRGTTSPPPAPWCSPFPSPAPPSLTHRFLQDLGSVGSSRALLLAAEHHRGGSPGRAGGT